MIEAMSGGADSTGREPKDAIRGSRYYAASNLALPWLSLLKKGRSPKFGPIEGRGKESVLAA
jgi:hypothetical protein